MRVVDSLSCRLQETRQLPLWIALLGSWLTYLIGIGSEPRAQDSNSIHSISDYSDEPLRYDFRQLPTMSTRRSTRATSRQASSRGASPAISTADVPATPRRTSRRGGNTGNAPLPAVGLRTSTAYGTNTVPEPARAAGPQVGEQLNSVLGGILNPVIETNTSSSKFQWVEARMLLTDDADAHTPAGRGGRHSRGSTPAQSSANRSFHHESGIFNQAAIDDSVVQDSPELQDIPEERESAASGPFPESIDTRLEREEIAMRQELEALARRRLIDARAASGETTLSDIWITRELSWTWVSSFLRWVGSFHRS
jgi:hypothetical protein